MKNEKHPSSGWCFFPCSSEVKNKSDPERGEAGKSIPKPETLMVLIFQCKNQARKNGPDPHYL